MRTQCNFLFFPRRSQVGNSRAIKQFSRPLCDRELKQFDNSSYVVSRIIQLTLVKNDSRLVVQERAWRGSFHCVGPNLGSALPYRFIPNKCSIANPRYHNTSFKVDIKISALPRDKLCRLSRSGLVWGSRRCILSRYPHRKCDPSPRWHESCTSPTNPLLLLGLRTFFLDFHLKRININAYKNQRRTLMV